MGRVRISVLVGLLGGGGAGALGPGLAVVMGGVVAGVGAVDIRNFRWVRERERDEGDVRPQVKWHGGEVREGGEGIGDRRGEARHRDEGRVVVGRGGSEGGKAGWKLEPGWVVGAPESEEDEVAYEEQMAELVTRLGDEMALNASLADAVRRGLDQAGYAV